MTEYYWPLQENGAVSSYDNWLKMPWVDIIRLIRSLGTYNQLKNYDSFYEMEIKSGEENHDWGGISKRKAKADYKWSTWGITSAIEYDLVIVPELGNDGWKQMIGGGGISVTGRR